MKNCIHYNVFRKKNTVSVNDIRAKFDLHAHCKLTTAILEKMLCNQALIRKRAGKDGTGVAGDEQSVKVNQMVNQ